MKDIWWVMIHHLLSLNWLARWVVDLLVAANGRPVAKISDEPGKSMCEDLGYLQYLASQYGIDPKVVKISN